MVRVQFGAEIAGWCLAMGAAARRLMCLRGVDTLPAAGGQFHRFKHPAPPGAISGVTPSEHSSGERRRRGPITNSGGSTPRQVLVEAAW
jgi:transposase